MAEINLQYVETLCSVCGWRQNCSDAQMVEMLRAIRKLSVSKAPAGSILVEIFRHSVDKMACPACQYVGLQLGSGEPDGDWPEAKTCDGCGRVIEAERLAAVPKTTMCVTCMKSSEQADATVEHEYCSKCGSLMQLVPSSGRGLSRYVLRCSGGCR